MNKLSCLEDGLLLLRTLSPRGSMFTYKSPQKPRPVDFKWKNWGWFYVSFVDFF